MENHLDTPVIDIDAKLGKLWNEELGKDRIRACLFNLIIYSTKGENDECYQKLLQSVISKFPCRIIWIKEDKKTSTLLSVDVKAETVFSNVYCEIIEIDVSSDFVERVPYLVLPHIIADLPLYLLWTEDPSLEKTLFPSFANLPQKIIFDLGSIENLPHFSSIVRSMLKQFPGKISDLNWRALKGWRELFASIFDIESTFTQLTQAKSIQITFNNATGDIENNEIRAIYFQGWLASCLQWKFQNIEWNHNLIRIHYKSPYKDITIHLIGDENRENVNMPKGILLSCEIETEKNGHFIFKRNYQTKQIFCQYYDDDRCDLPICHNLHGIAEGQEIIEEIFYQSRDLHYKNMLDSISSIPWKRK